MIGGAQFMDRINKYGYTFRINMLMYTMAEIEYMTGTMAITGQHFSYLFPDYLR